MRELKTIFYYLLISILAIFIIFIMVFFKSGTSNTIAIEQKLFLAGVFIISCLFGISIAVYPNWWRKNKSKKNHSANLKEMNSSISFKAHHPDCSMFKSHVIIIRNKPRCAGCLGLTIGALISIFLMILYLVFPVKLSTILYYILFFIGIFLLIFVYAEIIFLKRRVFFHVALNILLILSFFLITISVFELTENLIYSILTILLCFLLLDTRILFSKYEHKRICNFCNKSCKSF